MEKSPRQGDLLFVPTELTDYERNRQRYLKKNGVIREGEATGHHHKLENVKDADVFFNNAAFNGEPIIVVGKKGATVEHPEHGPVQLEPNTTYSVHFAREMDILGDTRVVAD